MLKNLSIRNYALIESLDLDFSDGFSVITGETGAGKSILLGAIGLLTGQRADTSALRNGAAKCIVEGTFDIRSLHIETFFEENDIEYEEECIIRREISASGKSRAFVNDTPVTLGIIKQLGEQFIDIHSQHQNLLLNTEYFQLQVLDILTEDTTAKGNYLDAYTHYTDVSRRLKTLEEHLSGEDGNEEYIRFQLQQLEEWNLKEGEQEELEKELDVLTHAEEIKGNLFRISSALANDEGGQLSQLKDITGILRSLTRLYPEAEDWNNRMESVYIELKDIAGSIEDAQERISYDPARQTWVEERLNTIYTAEQRHHVDSINELLLIEEHFRESLNSLNELQEEQQRLSQEKGTAFNHLLHCAELLTASRQKAAKHIEKEITDLLIELGIPNCRFQVSISPRKQPDATGMDNISFLFSANKNGNLQNIAEAASGGEISRIMLSLKAIIAQATALPTLIFDEIDTGVSGHIADKMGDIMQGISKNGRQVISITHLPQIAAKGKAHYKVYKEDQESGTVSHICPLTPEQRIREIAQMMSGSTLTDAAVNNAKELLNQQK